MLSEQRWRNFWESYEVGDEEFRGRQKRYFENLLNEHYVYNMADYLWGFEVFSEWMSWLAFSNIVY